MLVGLFLRHFKTYKGATYIPFGTQEIENFNLFIGQNGAGKSSILEALDFFFNDNDFVIYHSEKKSEAFVAPLFLIKKEDINKFDKPAQNIISELSDIIFSIKEGESSNYKVYKKFFTQKENFEKLRENYFLVTVASFPFIDSSSNNNLFFTFDNYIKGQLSKNLGMTQKDLNISLSNLKKNLISMYSYQYIPVETSLSDFLRLESKGMQDLMSENIKKIIENALNEKIAMQKDSDNGKGKKPKTLQRTPLDLVNEYLETFISNIEQKIKKIDDNYSFQKDANAKTKITANHLTDIIIEAYFKKRRLKFNGKPVEHLSSGERKKALIDIAYAFLTEERNKQQKIILAIDEPESSLHISMCYGQFSRLLELATLYDIQIFITSHWYGSLPIISKGNLYHIQEKDDKREISEFSFYNYFQENGSHPDDIHFKSFYDLVSSIISSLRVHKKHWLIVEGNDDKNYIQKHISKELLENLIILPVGGSGIVLNIYNYLFAPLSQKNESKMISNKVICLVDTDFQSLPINSETQSDTKENNLMIRRLQYHKGKTTLERITNFNRTPTEIEECLNPLAFYQALSIAINKYADEQLKNIFNNFTFDENSTNSFILGDEAMIYLKPNHNLETQNPQVYKKQIHDFLDKNKSIISEEYCQLEIADTPQWIIKLESLFSK